MRWRTVNRTVGRAEGQARWQVRVVDGPRGDVTTRVGHPVDLGRLVAVEVGGCTRWFCIEYEFVPSDQRHLFANETALRTCPDILNEPKGLVRCVIGKQFLIGCFGLCAEVQRIADYNGHVLPRIAVETAAVDVGDSPC